MQLYERFETEQYTNGLEQLSPGLNCANLPQDAARCQNEACRAEFGLTCYRHHCRVCGGCFCYSCAPLTSELSGARRVSSEEADLGLRRIVALYHRTSTLCQIH